MLFSNSLLKNSSRSLAWFYLNSLRNGYESSILKGTLTDGEKQQLAGLLNHYGIELQAVYGYSSNKASDAIRSLLSGNAFVASQADARAYNEALGYLNTYSAQSGQAVLVFTL